MNAPVTVAALVHRAIGRIEQTRTAAFNLPRATPAQRAERSRRLARIADRERRWWGILAHAAYLGSPGLLPIAGKAAIIAAAHAQSDARFWLETSIYWAGRAAGLSDAEADEHVARTCSGRAA